MRQTLSHLLTHCRIVRIYSPHPTKKLFFALPVVATNTDLNLLETTVSVYLEISLKIAPANRASAAGVYQKYKAPFLNTVAGAKSKELLVRDEDVQVLHGFDSKENAQAYLSSDLFTADVVAGLKPLLAADPDVRIYQVA